MLSAAVAVVWRPPAAVAAAEVRLHGVAGAEVRLHGVAGAEVRLHGVAGAEVRLHGAAAAEVWLRAVVAAEEWAAISVVSVDGHRGRQLLRCRCSRRTTARPWATACAAFVLANVGCHFTAGSGYLVARSSGRIARTDLRTGSVRRRTGLATGIVAALLGLAT